MVENVGVVFRSRRYLIYMKMLWKGCGKSLLSEEKKKEAVGLTVPAFPLNMRNISFRECNAQVLQPCWVSYPTSFSNHIKPEKFYKLRSIFRTNLCNPSKLGHARNVASYDSRDSVTCVNVKASRDVPIGGPLMSKNRRVRVLDRWKTRWGGSTRSIQSSQLSAKWPRYGNGPRRERNRGGSSRMVLKPDRMRRNSRGRFCARWIFALERSSVAQLC